MSIDSVIKLREWGHGLEEAMGVPIMLANDRGLMLKTKGGTLFGVTPMPGLPALVFTAVIGVADEKTSARTLCELLALNISANLTGMGFVGMDPSTREIRFRLMWMPRDEGWTGEAFGAMFVAFCQHVDVLAKAFAADEIEKLLLPAPDEGAQPDSGYDLTPKA
ncbi:MULTISPECIES: type III secretion system chaperone [unclassified Bordetella]|uniref:type III secretion system chaperone n=1 Tax=unclassified Bordetella TaxID=2630031 RepID=UPI0013255888|nr:MULTISPECIES: type III secretion system chaperone [unclassified Bordetella]MVW70763.1 hypothetical protein [Bordetella sp. 15P40C-2]MVW80496.1 hypothetical protein [Bordetella sp. 02P26C-1]